MQRDTSGAFFRTRASRHRVQGGLRVGTYCVPDPLPDQCVVCRDETPPIAPFLQAVNAANQEQFRLLKVPEKENWFHVPYGLLQYNGQWTSLTDNQREFLETTTLANDFENMIWL